MIEYGGSLRRYRGTIPRINPPVLVDVERAQRRLNRLARSVPLQAPWEAPNAAKLDGQSVATWMRRNLATRAVARCSSSASRPVWAAQPEDMSLLHVLFYIRSAGSLEMLFDTEGGAQQDRFVGGSQLIPLRMADELGEDRVVLGAPVRRIEHSREGVTVHADGARCARQRARSSRWRRRSPARIAYDPPLPGYRDQLTQRMPLGTVAKCMADLRRAVLARRRACRARARATRPGAADLRQLAAGRLAGRAARLPRGSPGARARPPARRRSAAPR